jgi:uncharacterized protein (DUF427 family)
LRQHHTVEPSQESVWDYPRPPRLEATPKHIQVIFNIAFYPAAMDVCLVDGERAQPEAGRFYGGWIIKDILLR